MPVYRVVNRFTAAEYAVERPAQMAFEPGALLVQLAQGDDAHVTFAWMDHIAEERAQPGTTPDAAPQRPYITTCDLFFKSTEVV